MLDAMKKNMKKYHTKRMLKKAIKTYNKVIEMYTDAAIKTKDAQKYEEYKKVILMIHLKQKDCLSRLDAI